MVSWSILVVDDDTLARELIRRMLQIKGWQVAEAADGLEALDHVARNRPDLLILDVMMPRMDGLTVCRRLRGDPESARLPIIMLSAKTQLDAVEAGLRAGADRYLGKPVAMNTLFETVETVMAEKRGVTGTGP